MTFFSTSGPRLDLDPDIVAALDEDFDMDDPENLLDDDFVVMAQGGTPGVDGEDGFVFGFFLSLLPLMRSNIMSDFNQEFPQNDDLNLHVLQTLPNQYRDHLYTT